MSCFSHTNRCVWLICLTCQWSNPNKCDSWWRHQMKIFFPLLDLCVGNSPDTGEFPHKGQWRGALVFYFICALNKQLSKQSRCWWFETQSRSLWRHCNVKLKYGNLLQTHCTLCILSQRRYNCNGSLKAGLTIWMQFSYIWFLVYSLSSSLLNWWHAGLVRAHWKGLSIGETFFPNSALLDHNRNHYPYI